MIFIQLLVAFSLVEAARSIHCMVCTYSAETETGCNGDLEHNSQFVQACSPDMQYCFQRTIISSDPDNSGSDGMVTSNVMHYELGCAKVSSNSCETKVADGKEVQVCINTCQYMICNYPDDNSTDPIDEPGTTSGYFIVTEYGTTNNHGATNNHGTTDNDGTKGALHEMTATIKSINMYATSSVSGQFERLLTTFQKFSTFLANFALLSYHFSN